MQLHKGEAMSKIIFLDTETTGVEVEKHAIVQIGAIIEINESLSVKMLG